MTRIRLIIQQSIVSYQTVTAYQRLPIASRMHSPSYSPFMMIVVVGSPFFLLAASRVASWRVPKINPAV